MITGVTQSGRRDHDMIEHSHALHARTVLVDWMLGNSCSYACSYCPKRLHDGSIRWQKSDVVLGFFDQLHRHYSVVRGRRVWLQFTGGEPTMHPQIMRLLDEARARGFAVSLISNASRTFRFWEKIAPSLDAAILTYHNEFADLDQFLAIGGLLTERMPLHVNVTMHPARFDRTLDEARRLRDHLPQATIALKALRVGFGATLFEYTDAQRALLEAGLPGPTHEENAMPRGTMTARAAGQPARVMRANEILLEGMNRWNGFHCNAGIESLRVMGDGTVMRAVCGVGGPLGRLGVRPVAQPPAPVPCTRDACNCLSDILITKTRGAVAGAPATAAE